MGVAAGRVVAVGVFAGFEERANDVHVAELRGDGQGQVAVFGRGEAGSRRSGSRRRDRGRRRLGVSSFAPWLAEEGAGGVVFGEYGCGASRAIGVGAACSQRRSISGICRLSTWTTPPVATSIRVSSREAWSGPASRMTRATSAMLAGRLPWRMGFSAMNSRSVGDSEVVAAFEGEVLVD